MSMRRAHDRDPDAAHLSFDEIDLGNGAQLTQAIAPKVTLRCGSPCPTVTTIRAARTAPPMNVSAACPGNGGNGSV